MSQLIEKEFIVAAFLCKHIDKRGVEFTIEDIWECMSELFWKSRVGPLIPNFTTNILQSFLEYWPYAEKRGKYYYVDMVKLTEIYYSKRMNTYNEDSKRRFEILIRTETRLNYPTVLFEDMGIHSQEN